MICFSRGFLMSVKNIEFEHLILTYIVVNFPNKACVFIYPFMLIYEANKNLYFLLVGSFEFYVSTSRC